MSVGQESAQSFFRERQESAEQFAEAVFDRSALSWLDSVDPSDRAAAGKLSGVLQAKYHDRWLADILGEIQSGETSARSVNALRKAAEANLRGDPEGALRALEMGPNERSGEACRLRMKFERVYALHRSVRTNECFDLAAGIIQEAAHRPYPWLRAQASIEHATCAGWLGREGEAIGELRREEQELRGSRFVDLRLRVEGIRADVETNSGDPWTAWPVAQDVLSQWWKSAAAPNRAHQVLFSLSEASQFLEYRYAAWLFGKAAVEAIAETPNVLTEALGRTHVAALAESAGLVQEAMEELRRSQQLFALLPPSRAVLEYRLDADTAISASELARGDERAALKRLKASEQESSNSPRFQAEFERSRITGLAYEQLGDATRAETALRRAMQLEAQRIQSLPAKRERLSALGESASVFRALVKLLLENKHDPEAAYRTWVAFLRASDAANFEVPDKTIVPRTESWLGYVRLDRQYLIWLAKREEIRWFRVAAPAEEIDAAVRRLLSSVADPMSSRAALDRDEMLLFDQLLGPISNQISRTKPLLIVPDGDLTQLPFNLLRARGGGYLGDEYTLTVGSGLRASGEAPQPVDLKSALIIAQPFVPKALEKRWAYLTDSGAEAESIRKYFAKSVLLEGADATLQRFESVSPMPQVFHFSGHGFSNGGHGALVLASDGMDAPASLLTPEHISAMNFGGCRLAVLSACLTATGEREGPANPESLVRALLLAGAREVVASRWSVDSHATRRLMERLYAELAKGLSTPDALRAAAAQVRAQDGYQHPYYWAAFQVFR